MGEEEEKDKEGREGGEMGKCDEEEEQRRRRREGESRGRVEEEEVKPPTSLPLFHFFFFFTLSLLQSLFSFSFLTSFLCLTIHLSSFFILSLFPHFLSPSSFPPSFSLVLLFCFRLTFILLSFLSSFLSLL